MTPDWIFDLAGFAMLILLGVLAYQKKRTPCFIVLLAAVFCACFGHLGQISDAKATLGSLEIKLREVNDDVKQLKLLASLLGQSIIDSDHYAGFLGGTPAQVRDAHREAVMKIMKEVGVDQKIVDNINKQNYDADVRDYVWGLERSVQFRILKNDSQKSLMWQREFSTMSQKNFPPSDNDIRSLMQKFDVSDDFTSDLLEDYKYFLLHGTQRRENVWKDRNSWPGN